MDVDVRCRYAIHGRFRVHACIKEMVDMQVFPYDLCHQPTYSTCSGLQMIVSHVTYDHKLMTSSGRWWLSRSDFPKRLAKP